MFNVFKAQISRLLLDWKECIKITHNATRRHEVSQKSGKKYEDIQQNFL